MIRKHIFLLFLLMAMGWNQASFAQPVVNATIDTNRIVIGDHIRLRLEVIPASREEQVEWPAISDSPEGLEWLEIGKIDTIRKKDSFLFRQQLTFTGFDSGTYYIPSLTFRITDAVKGMQLFHTDSFAVNIETVAVDTTQPFKAIHDIEEVKSSWLDYWKLIVGVLVAVALIWLIYYLYKNRKVKAKEEDDKVPPEKAHERALRLLRELSQKNLWQTGYVKEFYAELSVILRNYLENRFAVAAMELTTDELLKLAKQDKRIKVIRPELKRILKTADLAKYAKAEPMAVEQEACMEAAFLIVQKTRIREEEGST